MNLSSNKKNKRCLQNTTYRKCCTSSVTHPVSFLRPIYTSLRNSLHWQRNAKHQATWHSDNNLIRVSAGGTLFIDLKFSRYFISGDNISRFGIGTSQHTKIPVRVTSVNPIGHSVMDQIFGISKLALLK